MILDKLETYTSLVQSIFDFIHSIVKTTHMRSILIQDLSDIMYYIIIFLQITNNMEEIWRIDPQSCLEGEDCYENSVRLSARTVLTVFHTFNSFAICKIYIFFPFRRFVQTLNTLI